jgi:2-polyprenyl-3-methyl-5-hydroxy-6-metoxy-1,4-benzoquinol methylase
MTTTNRSLTACPVCASPDIEQFIALKQIPVLYNVLWPDRSGAINVPRGDIHLCFCPVCGHVFNRTYEPERMEYTQDYENSLHFSARFQEYASNLAAALVEKYQLKGKQIIEIGAGQGDFLTMLCDLGGNTGVGFDPSYNPKQNEEKASISFVQDYYAEKYANYPADFICCRQVLEHIYQPAQFIQMLRRVIGKRHEMIVFFEVPNVEFTIYNLGIWDILYEHFSYFSRPSLAYIFANNGFQVHQVSTTFGDQFLTIEAQAVDPSDSSSSVEPEALQNLTREVSRFSENYQQKVREWQQRLDQIQADGKKAVVWGAGTKGISFLNNLNTEGAIDYVVDINPRKHGMHITGTGQEIVPPEFLQEHKPDIVIIMNANYISEIEGILKNLGISSQIMTA